jgi:hypothetical protein
MNTDFRGTPRARHHDPATLVEQGQTDTTSLFEKPVRRLSTSTFQHVVGIQHGLADGVPVGITVKVVVYIPSIPHPDIISCGIQATILGTLSSSTLRCT